MPRKRRTTQQKEVQDYRHNTATRKNNPPAGIAAQGKIQETPKQEYAYNPHLPPNLRSDPNGDADKLPELLQIAQQRKLTAKEAATLADALRHHEPYNPPKNPSILNSPLSRGVRGVHPLVVNPKNLWTHTMPKQTDKMLSMPRHTLTR